MRRGEVTEEKNSQCGKEEEERIEILRKKEKTKRVRRWKEMKKIV